MSYDEPDRIPKEQESDALIWHRTSEIVRELSDELRDVGLKMFVYEYKRNEYCGDRGVGREQYVGTGDTSTGDNPNCSIGTKPNCSCPHWFVARIESLFPRKYEPRCYISICKRKSVYEIRYKGFVPKDFWIEADNRTQEKGSHIHSYGLRQAAQDIKQVHQMAEMMDYKSIKYAQYHSNIFRHKEDQSTAGYGDFPLSELQRMIPHYLTEEFFQDKDGIIDVEVEEDLNKVLQYVVDKLNSKGKFERK